MTIKNKMIPFSRINFLSLPHGYRVFRATFSIWRANCIQEQRDSLADQSIHLEKTERVRCKGQ